MLPTLQHSLSLPSACGSLGTRGSLMRSKLVVMSLAKRRIRLPPARPQQETARSPSATSTPAQELLRAIGFESQNNFTDFQGQQKFSAFLVQQLKRIELQLHGYQQRDIADLLQEARHYGFWEPYQRDAYLRRTSDIIQGQQGQQVQALQQSAVIQFPAPASAPDSAAWLRQSGRLPDSNGSAAPAAPLTQAAQPSHGHPSNGKIVEVTRANGVRSGSHAIPAAPHHRKPSFVGNRVPDQNAQLNPQQAAQFPHPVSNGRGPRAVWSSLHGKHWQVPAMTGGAGDMLRMLQHDNRYSFIVLDIESTGYLSPYTRVIELAAYAYKSGEIFDSGAINVYPAKSSTGAIGAHGISNSEIHDRSRPLLREVAPAFLDFCRRQVQGTDSKIVLVAHNGKTFDFKYLVKDFAYERLSFPEQWLWLDTVILARSHGPSDISKNQVELVPIPLDTITWLFSHFHVMLAKLAQVELALRIHYQLPEPEVTHRAFPDVEVLSQILPHLLHDTKQASLDAVFDLPENFHGCMAAVTYSPPAQTRSTPAGKGKRGAAKGPQQFANIMQSVKNSSSAHDDLLTDIESSTEARYHAAAAAKQTFQAVQHVEPPSQPKARGRPPKRQNAPAASRQAEQAERPLADHPVGIQQASGHARGSDDVSSGPSRALHFSALWKQALDAAEAVRPELATDVTQLGLTPMHCRNLKAAELHTLWSVLQHYPREHISYASSLQEGQHVQLAGTVSRVRAQGTSKFSFCDMVIDVTLEGSNNGQAQMAELHYKKGFSTYRGQYAARKMAEDYTDGMPVLVRGKVKRNESSGGKWSAEWELDAYGAHVDKLDATAPSTSGTSPVYSARTPMNAEDFDKILPIALHAFSSSPSLQTWEPLPDSVQEQHQFVRWSQAVHAMHQPETLEALEDARRRLAFDELLTMQLQLLIQRDLSRMPRAEEQAMCMTNMALVHEAGKALPFLLTSAQSRALSQIADDLSAPTPMLRLLQGDVGCGKTIVAFLALLVAVGSGYQGAMLAPTEVLAEQHMRKLCGLLEKLTPADRPKLRAAMLTGSTKAKERRTVLEGLASGEIDIVVGTHAVIGSGVIFKNLGLGVIDEQHRFGVEQRSALAMKNSPPPHMLAMTATPIPRTLALVVHGDLAHSAIDEMPSGRLPVATEVRRNTKENRRQVHKAIKDDLKTGGRTFIVYPLVEASKSEVTAHLQAATEEHKKLSEEKTLGADVAIGLLHGRMPADDKAAALEAFADGRTPVLIATSVVEVGVDVPEASVMVVMGAERFGLAQLHQMRGRVGRSSRASRCFLMSTPQGEERLGVLEQSNNGFEIAQADLLYRGAGEVFGKKQSGREHWTQLKAASLPDDGDLLEDARAAAAELVSTLSIDPRAWPPAMLAAIAYNRLPNLDFYEVPLNTFVTPSESQNASSTG